METTQPDQLDWLDEDREADADRGSPGRMLAQRSLPRTDQGKRSRFVRTNGLFPLAMTAVGTPGSPVGTCLACWRPWYAAKPGAQAGAT